MGIQKNQEFQEKHAERAFQIWPVLVRAAQSRQTLTYEDLSGPTGIYQRDFKESLAVIKYYCKEHLKGYHLTVLVVLKSEGKPGKGLYDVVSEDKIDKAREKVFKMARCQKPGEKKKWKIMFRNPGLKAFDDFRKDWNEKNKKRLG